MATFRTSAAGGGTSGSTNPAVTITPVVGDLFVVFCAATETPATPTCTDNNGGTYTLVGTSNWGTNTAVLSCFVRNQLLANTTSTIVTASPGTNTAAEAVVVAYSGMTRVGAAAIRQSKSQANQAASTTPAPVFTSAVLTSNPTIGAIGNSTTPATLTPPTSWTERQDVGQSTPATGLEVVTRDSGFTGTTVTWGSTSASTFASFVVELDSSAAPATGDANITESPDTSSAAGGALVQGAASIAAAGDAASADAALLVKGAASIASGADTIAAAGTVASSGITGDANVTQGVGGVTAAGSVAIHSAATSTQGVSSVAAAGSVSILGSAADTQAAQTLSAAASAAIHGAASTAQGAQTTAAAGSVVVQGASATTQAAQTLVASGGSPAAHGDASVTQGPGTTSAVGSVRVSAVSALTQGASGVSAAGSARVTGAASKTQGTQTAAGVAAVLIHGASSRTAHADTLTAIATNGNGYDGSWTSHAPGHESHVVAHGGTAGTSSGVPSASTKSTPAVSTITVKQVA